MTQTQELLQKFIDTQIITAEANRMAVLAADANKKAVEENTREVQALSQAMILHNAKQEPMEALVKKHETALYGNEAVQGYLQKFDTVEEKVTGALKNLSAGVWILAAAILSGVGAWIWQVFLLGVKP
jgi:hypothetical protein